MTAQTQTRFDFDLLKRSFESWDLEPLLDGRSSRTAAPPE